MATLAGDHRTTLVPCSHSNKNTNKNTHTNMITKYAIRMKRGGSTVEHWSGPEHGWIGCRNVKEDAKLFPSQLEAERFMREELGPERVWCEIQEVLVPLEPLPAPAYPKGRWT